MDGSLTSDDIVDLLMSRHSKDFCIPECKTGPTHGARHRRMDVWAMAKSWSRPTTWAYEVKVSRSDFLQDEKWPEYLPYCNQLLFVCPYGLIDPSELPSDVGLLWSSKNATRLYVKKKAAHREVEIPEELWRYILMRSRPRENGDRYYTPEPNRDYWRRWLETRREDRELGHLVGRELAVTVRERVLKVGAENERLRREIEGLEDVRQAMDAAGVSVHAWNRGDQMVERTRKLARAQPPGFKNHLESVIRGAKAILDALE